MIRHLTLTAFASAAVSKFCVKKKIDGKKFCYC